MGREGLETGAAPRQSLTRQLLFKALKQNLKVKSFVVTSENALRIQVWTALIAILLLKWPHHLSKARWSLSNLASMLRLNLFTYRDLNAWLDNPFGTPPLLPNSQNLLLGWRDWDRLPELKGDLDPQIPLLRNQRLCFQLTC
jgi:hypothetical protein